MAQSLADRPTLRSAMRVHPALRGLAVLARSSGSPTMAASAASAGAAVGSQLLSVIGQVYWEDWRAGPVALNLFKCSLASCLFALVLATQAGFGIALPAISPTAFSMLLLSSILGIVVGDVLWLQALQMLGAEKVILLNAFNPTLGALVGIVSLGQTMTLSLWGGILLTSAGVTAAAFFKPSTKPPSEAAVTPSAASATADVAPSAEPNAAEEDAQRAFEVEVANMRSVEEAGSGKPPAAKAPGRGSMVALGCVLQLTNMLLDIAGAAITRSFAEGLTPWQINLTRFGSAAFLTALIAGGARVFGRPVDSSRSGASRASRRSAAVVDSLAARMPAGMPLAFWKRIAFGVLVVTFACPSLSNYALFNLPFAAYCALTSLGPMWAVPTLWAIKGQRPTWRGSLGATAAAAGAFWVSSAARALAT